MLLLYKMLELPITVLQIIMDFLDYNTQVKLRSSCKYYYESLYITNLIVNYCISKKITNDVIKKHDRLLYLNLYENNMIKDLSNQLYIKKLYINMSPINFENIKHLKDLEVLDISNNFKFFDIAHFQNLKVLYIRGINFISRSDLLKLPKLKIVYVIANYYRNEIMALLKDKVDVKD